MSFVAGQWVECVDDSCAKDEVANGSFYRVTAVSGSGHFVRIEGLAYELASDRFRPVGWQVGRTYKTKLEGVTVTITAENAGSLYGTRSDVPGTKVWEADGRGTYRGFLLDTTSVPHLTPYLADPEPSKSEDETTPVEPASQINPPSRYHRTINGVTLDLYDVAEAWGVDSHRIFHAVKKLVMAGRRGHKGREQDLREAIVSIESELRKMKGGA